MAFPYSYFKLTFGGSLSGTEEIFSCGLALAREESDVTLNDLSDLSAGNLGNIANTISDFFSDNRNGVPSKYRLEWFKIALIGTNGKYIGPPAEFIWSSPVRGGDNVKGFIPSTAVVYTLMSKKFKDPGKYNRFYLPTVPPNTYNFKLTNDETSDRAESASEFILALNVFFLAEFTSIQVRAVSQRVSSYKRIEDVKVGNIIDSQRRRRNRLYETYSEVPVLE